MPTSATRVTVCNMALDIIVEAPIATLTDATPYARWLNRNFSPIVEATLREQPWNFACELFMLSADPGAPAFRWSHRYALPPGWLRVLPITEDGSRYGRQLPFEIKSNWLMTNRGAPCPVECVMNNQEPGEWDSLFVSLIAARLAAGMAHRFTGKGSFVDRAQKMAIDALETAEQTNAFEGSLQPVDEYDIIRARGGDNLRGRWEW